MEKLPAGSMENSVGIIFFSLSLEHPFEIFHPPVYPFWQRFPDGSYFPFILPISLPIPLPYIYFPPFLRSLCLPPFLPLSPLNVYITPHSALNVNGAAEMWGYDLWCCIYYLSTLGTTVLCNGGTREPRRKRIPRSSRGNHYLTIH